MTATFNPSGMTVVLMGDESLTIACGDMLLAGGHRIAAVVTRDSAVQGWADGQGIPTQTAPRDLIAAGTRCDWLLSIANLRLIPQEMIDLAANGAINFHDGPLPAYAGLNTPAWAIINGEPTHGVSWHLIEGGVDEGDLLALRDWQRHDHWSACDRAVLQATDDVLEQGAIAPATWAACATHLSSAAEQLELVASIGTWHLISQLARSLEVPLEEGVEAWPPDGRAGPG